MIGDEISDKELVRMIREGLGDYYDPRFPELVLILARKGVISVDDVKEVIRGGEYVEAAA